MIDGLVTYFLLFLGWTTRNLSISKRKSFGEKIGTVLRILSKRRENITKENLRKAFPDKSEEWVKDTAVESYRNLGIVLIEVLAMKHLSAEDFEEYVKYDNLELIREVYDRGNGLILMSGHYGNWEYLAYTAGLFAQIPITVIVKSQHNPKLNTILNEYRTRGGNKVVKMRKAARAAVNAVRNGEAVALLADQSASGGKKIFANFFGFPAATYDTPAALALKYNVPIVCGFSKRQADGAYRVKLEELKFDDLKNDEAGVKELTERHVRALEEAVRERPELWAWQHRKWKRKPSG